MTPREAHADLLAEITALRDRVASLTHENAELQGALAQASHREGATSEILRVISQSPTDVRPVFDAIVENAARLCDGVFSTLISFDGELMRLEAAHNWTPEAFDHLARRILPAPPSRALPAGRAILDCTVIHLPDIELDQEFGHQELTRAVGFRSILTVPMLRDGVPLGAISVARADPGAFSDNRIALLKTFADQAVIAIENVRLFNETKEALEQQTATGEILRVIASSPAEVLPVFEAITDSAMRLFSAWAAAVFRYEGQLISMAAARGGLPGSADAVMAHLQVPHAPTEERPEGRTALTRTIQHVVDVDNDMSWGPRYREDARARGIRSYVAVPMLRGDVVVGVITVSRQRVGGFAPGEISLLQTFADQAVIAIENVRLFTETKEALERQTATAEILRVIAGSPTDLQPVLDAVAESAARLCEAADSFLLLVEGDQLRVAALHPSVEGGVISNPIQRGWVAGRAVMELRTVHVEDLANAQSEFPLGREIAVRLGHRTALAVPLLRKGVAIGALFLRRREVRHFSNKEIALLQTFADQAVIAIENVRLFKELEVRNRDLTTALDQQTATSEVLRVIARSPTDTRPVFETIIESAVRLCRGSTGALLTVEGEKIHLRAGAGFPPETREAVFGRFPVPLSRDSLVGRVILDGEVLHIPDFAAPDAVPDTSRARTIAHMVGYRSALATPMFRDGRPIGLIWIGRPDPGRFNDDETRLLRTFADQAVIAIENVRLFKELDARTRELTRSVGELTALGAVSEALSSTLDVDVVLDTIVTRANDLIGADGCTIFEYDEAAEQFHLRATRNLEPRLVELARGTPLRRGDQGILGRLPSERQPVQVPDITTGSYSSPISDALIEAGYRAVVAVPLVREDHLIGALTMNRKTPGEFPPETIQLLQTFATQSALAIQNARLFREIEEKSHQLEVASQHKSEFLANMSHELRTPLNAIIGFSEVLSERMFGELNEKQEEYSKDIHASGQHLLSLINDILDLSKIEAGRMELELTDFHLPTALDNALTLVRERAGRRGIALQMNVDSRLGQIQADERKVRQVVLNLLSNAIKFTPEGGRIEVAAVPKDGFVEVSVADTGVGIAPEDQEAIFEEFRQVGTADKKVEGTGLGLTLCRKFVELHGGRIWVKSQIGVGSTFTFTIPVRRGE